MTCRRSGSLFLLLYFSITVLYCTVTSVTSPEPSVPNCFSNVNGAVGNRDSSPQCTIITSKAQDFECEEIRGSMNQIDKQFRIRGEYGVLTIHCKSWYLLDFDYDGFRPTEAIKISYWKNVSVPAESDQFQFRPSLPITSVGLSVSIYSIQTLFEQFQKDEHRKQLQIANTTQPIIYSRTGRYIIHAMEKDLRLTTNNQSFYFFFEEPLMRGHESFIWNQYTDFYKSVPVDIDFVPTKQNEKKQFTIPCRPSHYYTTDKVILILGTPGTWAAKTLTLLAKFDPTVGFKVDSDKLGGFADQPRFHCQLMSPGSSHMIEIVLNSQQPSGKLFGVNQMKMRKDSDAISLEIALKFTPESNFAALKCSFNSDNEKKGTEKFMSWGTPLTSFQELQHSREFVLPDFSKLSYYSQTGAYYGSLSYEIKHESSFGVMFCTTGEQYKYFEYEIGINGERLQHPAGYGWIPRNVRMDKYIHLQQIAPDPSEVLYDFRTFMFVCRHATPYMAPPVLWFTRNIEARYKLVHIDSDYKRLTNHAFPTLSINLTSDIIEMFCSISFIDANEWTSSSVNLEIIAGDPPIITSTTFEYAFPIDSENRQMECSAKGRPTPMVWWERNDKTMGAERSGSNTLQLAKITNDSAGEYICRFKNPYAEGHQVFVVDVEKAPVVSFTAHTPPGDVFPFYWVIVAFAIVFIVATVSIYAYFRMRFNQILSKEEIDDFKNGVAPPPSVDMTAPPEVTPESLPYPKEYEIPLDQFTVDGQSVLGVGNFGAVSKGYVKNVLVACKTVKDKSDKASIKAFLSEIKVMIYLGESPFLVRLVGASTANLKQGIVYAFVEFCELGSLLEFLQKHRSEFLKSQYSNMEVGGLNVDLLITWSVQVARGMSYLGSKKVIHGDLAARNVLLTQGRCVKITDFGLSRQLYNYCQYVRKGEEPLPWRWLSIEALADLTFSIESDIWSYGILLWEIFSLGEVPYPGHSCTIDFIKQLKGGLRMECPTLMAPELFGKLVLPCWEKEPTDRLKFQEIIDILVPYQRYQNA